jgi:hypothetical protein
MAKASFFLWREVNESMRTSSVVQKDGQNIAFWLVHKAADYVTEVTKSQPAVLHIIQ